jgi:hydrogenase-4 component E
MAGGLIAEAVLVLVVLTNLVLLGSSRLRTCIRTVALQGIVISALPVLFIGPENAVRASLLAVVGLALKGVVFPALLLRILRDTGAKREVEPFVGPTLSLLAGVASLGFSIAVCARLDLPELSEMSSLAAPAGLATLLVGLFVIVSRRKALTQALGYVVLENGIYVFGVAIVGEVPVLVELGVLLDAFVAVFIMSIAAWHISREFNDIDVDRLDRLKG